MITFYTRMGKVSFREQIFRCLVTKKTLRPFSSSAGIKCQGYSLALQRAITDFGSDVAFNRVPAKMMEHYGIEISRSAARRITLDHAQKIGELQQTQEQADMDVDKGVEVVVAEIDGTMIPVVANENSGEGGDRRKTKVCHWKEGRLSLAHEKDSTKIWFAATMGSSNEAGSQLADCAIKAGAGRETTVHCVGDGAPWIVNQVDHKFGTRATYLIDFYHLCEYLHAAAKAIPGGDGEKWLEIQKERLKKSEVRKVLNSLELFLEDPSVPEEEAPVRACYRYITNRPGQFDYKRALDEELPIGSGEVESAHRYIIQQRLKLPGSWWLEENAQYMLSLRTYRASSPWEQYWARVA